jgi:hypothetical protein
VWSAAGGYVQPGHWLLVDRSWTVVADGPVKKVLERAREAAGILGGGEQERIGRPDLSAEVGHRGGEEFPVLIGIEGGEFRHPLVERPCEGLRGDAKGGSEHGRIGRAVAQTSREQQHTTN